MSMPGSTVYDVVVIGGGPAGIAAARAAAGAGVRVALVESTRPGGACVHETCVPTEILLRTVGAFNGAEQLDALGIATLGSTYQHRKVVARKDELVRSLSAMVAQSLSGSPIDLVGGFGRVAGPGRVHVSGPQLDVELETGAIVVTAGCSWTPPTIAGLSADLLATPDVVHSQPALPGRVAVLSSVNSGGMFPLEYASYLIAAGVEVDLVCAGTTLLPGIDADLDPMLVAAFEAVGCRIHLGVTATTYDGTLHLSGAGDEVTLAPDLVLAADCRTPNSASAGLASVGIGVSGPVPVDERASCAPGVFAAGDVTGGAMLSSAASASGAVAGANAAGGSLVLPSPGQQPYVMHGLVSAAWIGPSESEAAGLTCGAVVVGIAEATGTAQAVVTASEGTAVKVVADELGQLLGVHASGEGAGEIVNAAATLLQLEATVDDVAALRPWHPSWTELLVDAARAAIA